IIAVLNLLVYNNGMIPKPIHRHGIEN
ncbi:MAG: hypothetical protein UR96_C0002G0025, partial [candidate division WS6 bacterium GW2011_GWC1_36_11]